MFPEYRDLIARLKQEDAHFARLFERHNELDHQVHNMETGVMHGDGRSIEVLKKEKLRLKDSLYTILRRADASAWRA
ncbi:hypothetical protein K788_0004542 [Paraburkholderia caribensis MBA4]|uniref:DUF465 domain-containing protein n=1 Tax=Paraburkholderia caribensis MBA4 TaxID=1323664 RepID=A0A0P0RAS1_9BURK|nr:YdcH family protein [Paraburkholderia caribensis]ALL65292.1 hypothetical protein K788_0004542 [Paraburkholderia caribensis MBA4]